MSVDWMIAPKIRCDLRGWSGPNYSGYETLSRIFAAGGRQKDDIDGLAFGSCWVVAPFGTRVIFSCAPEADEQWLSSPWRAVVIRKGSSFMTKAGLPGIRIPDLNWLDKPNAQRTDPDFQEGFPQAKTPDEGKGWTFGTGYNLRNRIHSIRIDKIKV